MSVAGQTPTVRRILAYVAANPGTSSSPIPSALGLTARDIGRRLSDAMKRGYLTRTGDGPSGFECHVTPAGKAHADGVAPPRTKGGVVVDAVVDVGDLPLRAAELVREEPWSTTAELAADLDVDHTRADQALRTAARRGQVVGEVRLHRGRIVKVWRAVGIGAVSS